jgi:hypothetical protein
MAVHDWLISLMSFPQHQLCNNMSFLEKLKLFLCSLLAFSWM